MVNRNPIWIRVIAGAAFVYAWVLIVYTPPKHRHTTSLKQDETAKQQLTKDTDGYIDTATNNEAIAVDTLTEAYVMAVPVANSTFPNEALLLIGDAESSKGKPTTKKPDIIGPEKNILDKQLDSTPTNGKQDVSADTGREQSQLSNVSTDKQDISQTNENELSNTERTTYQNLEGVSQTKDKENISQNLPSQRQEVPQINKKNISDSKIVNQPAVVPELTNMRETPVYVPTAAPESKPLPADGYPEPHDVAILPTGVCPPSDVVTIIGGGSLANCIWEYVTVWSLSRFLPGNRVPFAQKLIIDALNKVFDGINLPTVEDLPTDCECCKSTNWTAANAQAFHFIPLKNVTARFSDFKGHVILPNNSLLLEPVFATIEQFRKEFIYKDELVISAQNVIRNKTDIYVKSTQSLDNTSIVYVGVYVPTSRLFQTDITTATAPEYFVAAMNYFRKRKDLGKPIFLVVSDDVSWVETNMKADDVFVANRGGTDDDSGYDIAMLSHCNHSIIDNDSLGLWVAVYAGGETVTINTTTQIYRILSEKPNWHFVEISPTGEIVIP